MKPHRLSFCALGPYAGKVEVDFDPLFEEGLFLIHGPTGAGKTFLLDALCFALYGDVPGERGRHTLRSDHAPLNASPWAELEFTSQGIRWRINRSPEHETAKTRGEGTTRRAAKATLERNQGGKWRAVAQKTREVNEEITRLLGLSAQQFQQVILLPQGRFEKVLRSNSEDREKLLRTLFDTLLYKSASDWLDDEARRLRDSASEQERELANLRRQAAERWQSVNPDMAVGPTSAGEVDSQEYPPADQRALDGLVERAKQQSEDAATEAAAANAAFQAAQTHKDTIDRISMNWDRRAQLCERRDDLAKELPEIDADRETLRLAVAAESLRQILADKHRHRTGLERCSHLVTKKTAAVVDKCNKALSLPDDLTSSMAAGEMLRHDLSNVSTALALHRSKLNQLEDTASRAKKLELQAAAERNTEASNLRIEQLQRAEAEEHERQRLSAVERLTAAQSAAGRVGDLKETAKHAHERAEAATALAALNPSLDAARVHFINSKQETLDLRSKALDIRQRYLDGIAAVLAGTLESDTPCPVCGSSHHPSPAELSDEAVDAQDLEEADNRTSEAAEIETQAQEQFQQLSNRAAGLKGTAGENADDPVGANEEADEATALWQEATELAEQVQELGNTVTTHQMAATTAQEAAIQAALDATNAAQRAEVAESEAVLLRARIAEEIGDIDPTSAADGVGAVETAIKELIAAVDDRGAAETAFRTTVATLTTQLEATPFATSVEASDALRSPEERSGKLRRITAHDKESHNIDRDLEANDLKDLPDQRPDTATPAFAVTDAEAAANAASAHHTRTEDAFLAISAWADDHRIGIKRYTQNLSEAALWTEVADRCNGRTPPKVSLQRWVLSAYLEEICNFANRRLGSMTGGRYQLSVHRDRERGGGKAGLGLRVHDTYTGQEREVSTLSGGETFQASLSLALGVADAVASHTGGVRLDALFVDEGFGTLDPEALQLAMDELDRLREGGRTVGLISHVGELRERIRTGIEIHPTDQGSTVSVGTISPV